MSSPLVLGIETSCDDTACAVVDGAGRVLASVVSSQLAQFEPYGGVVPELAAREQLSAWPRVLGEALARAQVALDEIGAVAATSGPGLVGSLLVGLSAGRALAWARGLQPALADARVARQGGLSVGRFPLPTRVRFRVYRATAATSGRHKRPRQRGAW